MPYSLSYSFAVMQYCKTFLTVFRNILNHSKQKDMKRNQKYFKWVLFSAYCQSLWTHSNENCVLVTLFWWCRTYITIIKLKIESIKKKNPTNILAQPQTLHSGLSKEIFGQKSPLYQDLVFHRLWLLQGLAVVFFSCIIVLPKNKL